MEGLLMTRRFATEHGARVEALARETGRALEPIVLESDPEARLPPDAQARVELAFMSGEVYPDLARAFLIAALKATRLRWLHVAHTGMDAPVFRELQERGVLLTNSVGVSAVPIAHTALAGLLMLARDLPHYLAAQRERRWERRPPGGPPVDLAEQTLLVLGLGHIGSELARLARPLGLRVVGVRRSPRRAEDPVDEVLPPERLDEALPRADWLAITCPLTAETRGLLDARRLALLPRGARVLNVARGGIVDEAALVRALEEGRLGGAYLDVFASEPLPEASPLWALPNVLITPHASSLSAGSRAREDAIFLDQLRRHLRGEALANRVARLGG